MRIATAYSYDKVISDLQRRQQDLSDTQTQLVTGKRVNVASDDPTAAARAERALATIARTDADKRSLDASVNVMNITEAALGDAVELIQSARETLVAGGNGSYSDSDRQSLAVKLQEIRKQLLSVANRPDGGGGFVFAGQGAASPPFVDAPGGVIFQGQSGEMAASSSEKLNLTVDGRQVWLQARTGNGVFTAAPAGTTNTGSGWISSGSVTGPSDVPYPAAAGTTPPAYTVEFEVTGGVTTYSVYEDGAPLVTGQPYKAGTSIPIPGRGMSVTVSGAPANGDTFSIGESESNLSIFTTLDKAIAALNTPMQGNGGAVQAVNTAMVEIDSVLGNIQASRSAVGEALNRMDGIADRISSLKLAAQTEKSNAEDLDMVQAISEFQNKQAGYEAALKSYSLVQKMSFFNYVG